MQTSSAVKFQNQPSDREQLEEALKNWREVLLRYLRDQMVEANEERQAAENGLAIAHRNQGEVREEVVGILWDQLEEHSTRLFRLARMSDRIQEMSLPELVVLFQRTHKVEGYPWEGERWELPQSMF